MIRNSISTEGLPSSARQAIETVGNNIRTARKRRGWSLDEMAGSMLVTRKTLSRLESGDPAVGLSVLAVALHCLIMTDDLKKVAAPESDSVGLFYEQQRLPRRVRKKQTPVDDLDF
ncbi:MAG: helix-turn-helix transcriptional regulator [Desulfuromonadales bacterium]|nr:helix-turn-helix transcriptional regulator [Desulfuromonadales bacterium]